MNCWQPLHDPEPERDDQNFKLDGKDYNFRAAETHRVITDLDGGILTRYPLNSVYSDAPHTNSDQSTQTFSGTIRSAPYKTNREEPIMINELNDPIGLTPVAGNDQPERKADLIFIHGLGGGSQTTWAAEGKPENFWPAWIADEFPNLGVWTLGYGTTISAWNERSMPLADLGHSILDLLVNKGIGSRPIIFATHSMGGLAAKQILNHARTQGVPRFKKVAEQTRGVAFIATPHAGAKLANFAEFTGIVLNATEQVTEIKQHDSRLRELHQAFLTMVGEQKLVCRAYAERHEVKHSTKVLWFNVKLPKSILVVDPTSAEPHIPGEVAVPLDEDHISICKPKDRKAQIHESVCGFLRECIESIERPQ